MTEHRGLRKTIFLFDSRIAMDLNNGTPYKQEKGGAVRIQTNLRDSRKRVTVHREQELDNLVVAFGRHVHENHPNPDRLGCPPKSTLSTLASDPSSAREFASVLDHICRCAACLEDLAQLRKAKK